MQFNILMGHAPYKRILYQNFVGAPSQKALTVTELFGPSALCLYSIGLYPACDMGWIFTWGF